MLPLQVVPFEAIGFEHIPVIGSHVPATWHGSVAVHVMAPLSWHVPLLVHVPEPRHGLLGEQSAPTSGAQVPVVQVWQVPHALVMQQREPTQKPDPHSVPPAHT